MEVSASPELYHSQYFDRFPSARCINLTFTAIRKLFTVFCFSSLHVPDRHHTLTLRAKIHQASWTWMKAAYLFCRYYTTLVFPFALWAWLGSHDLQTCLRVIPPLYATLIPLRLSGQAVMLTRAYVFTGKKRSIFVIFVLCFISRVIFDIWLFGVNFILSDVHNVIGNSGCFGSVYIGGPNVRAGLFYLSAVVLDVINIGLVLIDQSLTVFLSQAYLYFLMVSVLNVTASTLYFQRRNIPLLEFAPPFAQVLSNVICRSTGLPAFHSLASQTRLVGLRQCTRQTESIMLAEQSLVVREGLRALDQPRDQGIFRLIQNDLDPGVFQKRSDLSKTFQNHAYVFPCLECTRDQSHRSYVLKNSKKNSTGLGIGHMDNATMTNGTETRPGVPLQEAFEAVHDMMEEDNRRCKEHMELIEARHRERCGNQREGDPRFRQTTRQPAPGQ
ncbi:hypothetical protein BU15DRAFT_61143 [Melanogaster broomeanus]|nr:hypothetical protein BU15DRAFT_61143 [Melanogaster broomeanus]